MDFQTILAKRRSTRRFLPRPVPRELIDALLRDALTAPSARNSRSTRFLAVDDPALIARMAEMRDYGSSFMRHAPAVVLVLGNPTKSDLWRENAAIAATILQLACVDRGLASCWVHVHGRPRRQDAPEGEQAEAFLRELLSLPGQTRILCAVALGHSDFTPAPLPPADDEPVIWPARGGAGTRRGRPAGPRGGLFIAASGIRSASSAHAAHPGSALSGGWPESAWPRIPRSRSP